MTVRRSLLLAATLPLLVLPTTASAATAHQRAVPASSLPAATAVHPSPRRTFDPDRATLAQLQRALRRGDITSVQLVDHYLARIRRYDDQGPELHAITSINGLARRQAAALDRARAQKKHVGALYGIPFVVKDNYDVVGMPTTGGSVALANNSPAKNATVVQRLLDQGAIVLAKTNMSELAASYGRLGYSSSGGLTLNPFDLRRNASGSSSGTAVAVAARFAPFGLGTDTSGSVRGPASVTGQVGIRPTLGLTSRSGVIPLSLSADTTAPVAGSVADEATVLQVIAGADPSDAATASAQTHRYATRLDTHALRGARVGVLTSGFGGNAEVDAKVDAAIALMRRHGTTAVEVDLGSVYDNLWTDVLGPVGNAEFSSEFEHYLTSSPAGTIKTVDELIAISTSPGVEQSADPVNPARIEGYRTAQASRSLLGGAGYQRITTQLMPQLRRHVQQVMKQQHLDALVFPTLSCVASPRFDRADASYSCSATDPYTSSYIASSTGLPEVTIPVGANAKHLPIGMSFLGASYTEQELLDLAASWQRVGKVHLHPRTVR